MTTIYNLKLEPLEERYTAQWESWFSDHFDEEFDEHVELGGEPLVEGEIEEGAFLDLYSTTHYKDHQLKEMAQKFHNGEVEDGDKIFVADFWYPGIESLKYMADLSETDVEIYAHLHAGTYTKEDFAKPMEDWGKYQEVAWAKMFDGIFTGSTYAKENFLDRRIDEIATEEDAQEIRDKIHVTGNPFSIDEAYDRVRDEVSDFPNKRDKIIFPNRFDFEKRPNRFLNLAQVLKKRNPNLDIIVTTSRSELENTDDDWLAENARALEDDGIIKIRDGISKSEYYAHLAESKVMVSTTIEENFGYCNVEALTFNTAPVIPNDFSHPEIVDETEAFLYDDLDEAIDLIEANLSENQNDPVADHAMTDMARKYDKDKVLDRMTEVIKNGEVKTEPIRGDK